MFSTSENVLTFKPNIARSGFAKFGALSGPV